MNVRQLQNFLERDGFNPVWYRIEPTNAGSGVSDSFGLRRLGSLWSVYHTERGSERQLGTFDDESAACDAFVAALEKEPSSRYHLLTWFLDAAAAAALASALSQAGVKLKQDVARFDEGWRHRVFVDGRDLARARDVLDEQRRRSPQ